MDRLVSPLDLEIAPLTAPGRRAASLSFALVRPLQEEDIALLADNASIEPPSIKRISERHHALARLLASGVSPGEAAVIIGYKAAHVSVLQGDPSFKELVEFYSEKVDVAFMNTLDQLSGLAQDAVMEIRQRLEDEPEKFTLRELRETATIALDRSGHGPTHKQVTEVNINLGERLKEAQKRALEARLAMIDVTPKDAAE